MRVDVLICCEVLGILFGEEEESCVISATNIFFGLVPAAPGDF